MVLSVLVALMLTPALCATLLKPVDQGHEHGERAGHGFFGWFNRDFERGPTATRYSVGGIIVRARWRCPAGLRAAIAS